MVIGDKIQFQGKLFAPHYGMGDELWVFENPTGVIEAIEGDEAKVRWSLSASDLNKDGQVRQSLAKLEVLTEEKL